jgi:hypothetical protein
VDRLVLFPESGAILFESYRSVLLKWFPYMAVYVVSEDRIYVLAIVSVRRDPRSVEATVAGRADESQQPAWSPQAARRRTRRTCS